MRRYLKRILSVLLALVLLPLAAVVLFLGGLYGKHSRIIGAGPPAMAHGHVPSGPAGEVNPFIGTGGYFYMSPNNSPGPQMPFGVMRLGPDTASMLIREEALNKSGYWYSDPYLVGFSHTRLVGTGATDGGHVRVLPTTTPLNGEEAGETRAVAFSHSEEAATPGYYTVRLPDDAIHVELTAARQAGVHRYSFSEGTPHLIVDVSSALGNHRSEDGYLWVDPNAGTLEGSIKTHGSFASRSGGITVYFAGMLSATPTGVRTWGDGSLEAGRSEVSGDNVGVEFAFSPVTTPTTIELRLGISHVDLDGAKRALQEQVAEKSFDDVVRENHAAWNDFLGRIRITGGNPDQRTIFYTALYRALQMPTQFSEVDGRYRGFDKAVHTADGGAYYTDLSLWDTFRTVHPLYSLMAPKEQRDMIRSLLAMQEQGGYLPRWPMGLGYSGSMFGTPSDIVISEAYQKGLAEGGTPEQPVSIMDFDVARAYEGMRETALAPTPKGASFSGRRGVVDYLTHGYCPADTMSQAVARTFEYGWADHAISQLAGALGNEVDRKAFAKHSRYYQALFNPENRFFQPKNRDGSFAPIDPEQLTYTDREGVLTDDYVEGSAWQWRWGAFYDAEAMIALWPDRDTFVQDLETFMEGSIETIGPWTPGPFYWQGNEHDIHAPYLFAIAGRPDLTQEWVRWILDTQHANDHVGLDGNDDGGTLSAWYVWSALGLYPVAGTDRYVLGTPLFEEATVSLEGGRTLRIVAEDYGVDRYRVERVTLNGEKIDGPYVRHGDLAGDKRKRESVLRFVMVD